MARTPTPRPVRRIQADIDQVKKNIAGCEKIIYKRNTAGGLRSTIFIASTGKEVRNAEHRRDSLYKTLEGLQLELIQAGGGGGMPHYPVQDQGQVGPPSQEGFYPYGPQQ